MTTPIHVLGFSGSLRKASYNTALLRVAGEMLPEGMTLEIFDLTPLPFFNTDVEAVGVPEPVQHFKARISAADALLIACPEYNQSVTGALKNAIDWASRPTGHSPLDGKPFAIMGAGGMSGTARAQAHLRQIAAHVNMLPVNKPNVLIPRAGEKFDAEGRLTDEYILKNIHELLVALSKWTQRLQK